VGIALQMLVPQLFQTVSMQVQLFESLHVSQTPVIYTQQAIVV
jgi:hypothetical protein